MAVAQLADDLAADRPAATLADFVADLQKRAELGHAPVLHGVTLATMHAAKGLEWDTVVLPGLVEGVMPIVYARTPAAVEERTPPAVRGRHPGPDAAVPVLGQRPGARCPRRGRAVPLPDRAADQPWSCDEEKKW